MVRQQTMFHFTPFRSTFICLTRWRLWGGAKWEQNEWDECRVVECSIRARGQQGNHWWRGSIPFLTGHSLVARALFSSSCPTHRFACSREPFVVVARFAHHKECHQTSLNARLLPSPIVEMEKKRERQRAWLLLSLGAKGEHLPLTTTLSFSSVSHPSPFF